MIEKPIRFHVRDDKWVVVLRQSQFHVFVATSEPDDIATFMNEVGSVVQGCLDALGFHLAIPLRAEILSLIIENKSVVYRDDQWAALLEGKHSMHVDAVTLGPFIKAALEDSTIRLALGDLRAAIDSPDDTVMLCYRAIEGARQWFLEGNTDEKGARQKAWVEMRTALQLDETEIRQLEGKALSRRHGALATSTEADRQEALQLARRAISALVDHRSHEMAQTNDQPFSTRS